MRALQCETLGKPSDLKLVAVPDLPSPKAGEIKVQVASAGLNFADTLMIAGQYQHKPELPFTPGLELAGTVLEVGPGETRIKPGDPIMAAVDHGGFGAVDGQRRLVPEMDDPGRAPVMSSACRVVAQVAAPPNSTDNRR